MPPYSPFKPGASLAIVTAGIILLQVVPPSVETATPAHPAFGSV